MRRILCIIAFIISVSATAQNVSHSISIIPKVGMNVASMTEMQDDNQRICFVGGVEGEKRLNNMLSLSFGVLYSQQGVVMKTSSYKGTVKMDYLTTPLLLNFYPIKGLAIKTGLEAGILVNDKVQVKTNGTSIEMDLEEALRQYGGNINSRTVIASLPVGISYEISNVIIDARYKFALSDAIKDNADNSKQNVFQLTFGYKFGL